MAFMDNLKHTVEVYRRVAGTDRFGQPKLDQFSVAPIATYAGRISYGHASNRYRAGEVNSERSIDVSTDTTKIYLPPTADIKETDYLIVKNSIGGVVLPKTEVKSVLYRHDGDGKVHHIEAQVETWRSAEFQPSVVS